MAGLVNFGIVGRLVDGREDGQGRCRRQSQDKRAADARETGMTEIVVDGGNKSEE